MAQTRLSWKNKNNAKMLHNQRIATCKNHITYDSP